MRVLGDFDSPIFWCQSATSVHSKAQDHTHLARLSLRRHRNRSGLLRAEDGVHAYLHGRPNLRLVLEHLVLQGRGPSTHLLEEDEQLLLSLLPGLCLGDVGGVLSR